MRVAVIPGDGIGKEVMDSAIAVLEELDLNLKFEFYEAGDETLAKYGKALPDETLEACKKSDATLFGAVGETAADVIIRLRQELDAFANVRPARAISGVKCLYPGLDIVVVRENTECLYKGWEFEIQDSAFAIRIITEKGSERIARFAFEFAKKEGRRKVTALHKANVMKKTCGIFRDVCRRVAKEYDDIKFNEYYIDAACMFLVMDPFRFDVIVTTNMFGDIVSDLTAGLVGGLGIAPSANIGEKNGIFEPVHGAAFDIAGKGIANPTAMILTAAMMLRSLGFMREAKKIEMAIEKTISEGKKTPDLGGNLKTLDFTREVIKNLQKLEEV
ncbi:MAG: isocitrate/isopropylmalate family dehydrogenase [Archaeoglobaceae archaeon]|nr:isocitrate/isopropylmalate family dehydrogenase [Archaeoglobaceae archaeon]MDW7989474.1 isocitrate/isopropylmalate family dehydrogenase [Archaeoglobaceae archaeon]